MVLTYLKITPEKAVILLEECVESGYQLKDLLEADYKQVVYGSDVSLDKINSWTTKLNEWTNKCLDKLSLIFITSRQQYNFRDAKVSGMSRIGINRKYDNIISHLQARIDILDGYINFIFQRSNIQIIAGRDANIQVGNTNKLDIQN